MERPTNHIPCHKEKTNALGVMSTAPLLNNQANHGIDEYKHQI